MKKTLGKGLYAITDCENLAFDSLFDKTRQILNVGIVALQYRDKSTGSQLRRERARTLQAICKRHRIPFLINDDIQLALDIQADGVHIGKNDAGLQETRQLLGQDFIIGVSCYNNIKQAETAQAMGADYIAFGAFYPTTTKQHTVSVMPTLLSQGKDVLNIPIVAIGGITPENGGALVEAGADMLAVISSIYSPAEPAQVILQFNKLFQVSSQVHQ